MRIEILTEEAEIKSANGKLFRIVIELERPDDILEQITVEDAIDYYNTEEILNKIGIDNGTVTIGVPGNIAQELALQQSNKKAILIIVDIDAFDKYI